MAEPVDAAFGNRDGDPTSEESEGRLRRFLQIFGAVMRLVWASKIAVVGLTIVLFWVMMAIFAPWLTPYSPTAQDWAPPAPVRLS